MLPQNHDLDMTPNGVPIVVNVSQYDVGREINFYLYNGSEVYTPAVGALIRIEGTKPDNTGFSYSATYTGNKVTISITDQMTVLEGEVRCELRVTEGGSDVGSLNFILLVEKAALRSDIPISDTEIPAIIELARAEQYNAEAWANGTRNGTPVDPTDPTYHNNAKYWSENTQHGSLDNLSDVAISSPVGGQALVYDDVNDEWVNGNVSTVDTLDDLTDVSLVSPTNGQVLTFNNNEWKNESIGVDDLDDIVITNPANDDGLVYDSTSQKWKNKQIVQKNQISNPNLLDNPWFTINQRGSSTYTGGGYTVDRWLFGYGDITCSVVNSGITLSSTIEGSNYVQYIEEDYYNKFIAGKNVTLSALLADGTIKSKTAVAPINTSSYQDIGVIYLHSDCTLNMVGRTGENEQIQIRFPTANANPISIRAIKLELGTVSTLGLDAAPNYEEELLRCQRYYWRGHYAQYATVAEFDSGASWTEIFIGVNAMRATPALTISGSIDYVAIGGETPWVAYSNLRVQETAGGYALGGNRGVAGSPTAGYCYSSDAGGTTIELSADL